MSQHKKPCKGCPWTKSSLRGWLGESTPVEFVQTSEAEHRMPCHNTVDYERDDWRRQADKAPQCAGRAIHFANRCKLPRDPGLLVIKETDRENVFSNPQDFIDHHTLEPVVPVIMIANGYVHTIGTKEPTRENP